VAALAPADPEQLRGWFATGMFLNVMSAMDVPATKRPWARELMGELLLDKKG
jgi:hypothetical protein